MRRTTTLPIQTGIMPVNNVKKQLKDCFMAVPVAIFVSLFPWTAPPNLARPEQDQDRIRARLVVQTGHTDVIRAVDHAPNGKILASGDSGGVIKLRDIADGRELLSLKGHLLELLHYKWTRRSTRY